jgi:hypothetical protein
MSFRQSEVRVTIDDGRKSLDENRCSLFDVRCTNFVGRWTKNGNRKSLLAVNGKR